MKDLTKYNSKKLSLSRFYDELKVKIFLVYKLGNKDHSIDKEIDLLIGKRRALPLCLARMKPGSNLFMMVKDDNRVIAYDKFTISTDADSQRDIIDVEGYLQKKGYEYIQLDSKKYARERAKKKEFVSCEINQYGEFSVDYWWLDIDVYEATSVFFRGACKVGDMDVLSISSESFGKEFVEILRKLTKKKNVWDVQLFTEFLEKLSAGTEGLVITETAEIQIFDYSRKLKISRNFDEGDYSYAVSVNRYEGETTNNQFENIVTFLYAIMHASSLSECKSIETKTKLLYGNIHL